MGPKLTTEELARAVVLFNRLYERHCAGCCHHVVLDDHNVEDRFLEEFHKNQDCQDPAECRELYELLKRMSQTQRAKLGARGYESFARSILTRPN